MSRYWQSYGFRAAVKVSSLRSAIEHIRALAGSMQLPYDLRIVSPGGKVWVIPADTDLERANAQLCGNRA